MAKYRIEQRLRADGHSGYLPCKRGFLWVYWYMHDIADRPKRFSTIDAAREFIREDIIKTKQLKKIKMDRKIISVINHPFP